MGDVGTWSLPPALGDHLAEARQHSAVCRNRIVELFAAPKTKRPCRCASRVSPRRGRLYVWAFQASPPCLVQLYIMAKLTTWTGSVPNSANTASPLCSNRAGNGRFRREFGDRKRAEGTNFFTYPYSSGSRCRSFFYSPRRNHVGSPRVGFVGRTPQPPDTPNPKSVPEPRMPIMPGLCVLTRCWRHRE
jgi:hypothetical protein